MVQISTRRAGAPSSTAHDHVCWGYRRPAEFAATALQCLADGLAAGERVLYVAPGDESSLEAQVRTAGLFDAGPRRGAGQVASVDATYTTGTVVDPAGQVALYATATAEALAAGFRVAAEAAARRSQNWRACVPRPTKARHRFTCTATRGSAAPPRWRENWTWKLGGCGHWHWNVPTCDPQRGRP